MPKSERGIIRESEYSIADCQTDPLVDGHWSFRLPPYRRLWLRPIGALLFKSKQIYE
jgi:hypothetical protein